MSLSLPAWTLQTPKFSSKLYKNKSTRSVLLKSRKFKICEPKFRKTEPNGVNLYTVRDDITRQDSIRPVEYSPPLIHFITELLRLGSRLRGRT